MIPIYYIVTKKDGNIEYSEYYIILGKVIAYGMPAMTILSSLFLIITIINIFLELIKSYKKK